jgi:tetratricopeptide (TPR) repeat protein
MPSKRLTTHYQKNPHNTQLDRKKAIGLLSKSINKKEANQKKLEEYFEECTELYNNGQYQKALDILEKAIKLEPTSNQLQMIYGAQAENHKSLENYPSAIEIFKKIKSEEVKPGFEEKMADEFKQEFEAGISYEIGICYSYHANALADINKNDDSAPESAENIPAQIPINTFKKHLKNTKNITKLLQQTLENRHLAIKFLKKALNNKKLDDTNTITAYSEKGINEHITGKYKDAITSFKHALDKIDLIEKTSETKALYETLTNRIVHDITLCEYNILHSKFNKNTNPEINKQFNSEIDKKIIFDNTMIQKYQEYYKKHKIWPNFEKFITTDLTQEQDKSPVKSINNSSKINEGFIKYTEQDTSPAESAEEQDTLPAESAEEQDTLPGESSNINHHQ